MSVGKPPDRPAGKARADNERMQAAWMSDNAPHAGGPSEKEAHMRDLEQMDRMGGDPTEYPAEPAIGGSRPGVESRVKDAIERREAREAGESEEGD